MGLPSEAAGPLFLSLLLAAAGLIAWHRRYCPIEPRTLVAAAGAALALQALHVAEEYSTGFQRSLPALLGLPGWSDLFFVAFNLAWLAIWSVAISAISAGYRSWMILTVLWFLALASVGNLIWHPLLSLATGAYFPGTLTALAMAFTGPRLISVLRSGGRKS